MEVGMEDFTVYNFLELALRIVQQSSSPSVIKNNKQVMDEVLDNYKRILEAVKEK
jgi:hypothetical protein